jgi:hypothetical protein
MMIAFILQQISNWFQLGESRSNSQAPSSIDFDELDARLRALELR